MANGKPMNTSPIVTAIEEAESRTTGEIRVHLSRRWWEKDPYTRAETLFKRFGMAGTRHRNAVLLYVNVRKHKFAIIGDSGIHARVGQAYWEELTKALAQDLKSTHLEKALALAVRTIGVTLEHYFPLEEKHPDSSGAKELPNEVTED